MIVIWVVPCLVTVAFTIFVFAIVTVVFASVSSEVGCHRRRRHPHRYCRLPLYIAAAAVFVHRRCCLLSSIATIDVVVVVVIVIHHPTQIATAAVIVVHDMVLQCIRCHCPLPS